MNSTVSIAIIGRNEGQRLVRCLESVRAMVGRNSSVEVIYVDSGSTDASVRCALQFGASVVTLTGACTAARARNAGWRAANGEWVLFLDGDTIVHPRFIDTALAHATDPGTAAVWGHRREIHPTANLYHRVLDLDWIYAPGPSEFCGGDVLMRRDLLERANGFDDTLIAGEEPELCARLRGHGYQILHIDAPMTTHDLSISRFSQYWKRATRAGYAYAQLAERTSNYAQPMWRSETGRNAVRAVALVIAAVLVPLTAVALESRAVLIVSMALTLALVVRSAIRARWKSGDPLTLFCYAVHSHFQQLPIFAGQIAYRRDMASARRRELIEYK